MGESYPMNGGDGVDSYSKNSIYQREMLGALKEMISEAINEELDVKSLVSSLNTFRMADLGCSVGPNTFFAMQYILDSVEKKCRSQGISFKDVEFQVFFNDHVTNDFNMLFTSLPSEQKYYAAGVPGSFYDRLFPKSSLHFAQSSFALHWLSRLPDELQDEKSSAWNKGKIHHINSSNEVALAYATQFAKDIDSFLNARADEMVPGGMIVMTLLGLPDGAHSSENLLNLILKYYGSIFSEMVRSGLITEDQLDSFNFPLYCPYPTDMAAAVTRNKRFSIIRMEIMNPSTEVISTITLESLFMHNKAAHEGVITKHFGRQVSDEMYKRAFQMLQENTELAGSIDKIYTLYVVLKRN